MLLCAYYLVTYLHWAEHTVKSSRLWTIKRWALDHSDDKQNKQQQHQPKKTIIDSINETGRLLRFANAMWTRYIYILHRLSFPFRCELECYALHIYVMCVWGGGYWWCGMPILRLANRKTQSDRYCGSADFLFSLNMHITNTAWDRMHFASRNMPLYVDNFLCDGVQATAVQKKKKTKQQNQT